MQRLAFLVRLFKDLSEEAIPEPQPFSFIRHGDQSGGELFFDEVMAGDSRTRHQLFVTRH